jgi:superfamily II DNA or RNA helicase
MFGEGFDLPKLNGVCIAGNMKSIIRTVQYVLRPNRLELGNPNKKAYIIIPYIDNDPSYENLRIIIHHLRNVDENVEQKICVCTTKPNTREINEKEINDFTFVSNECDLTSIKLRLRYSKALHSKCSEEQDEYNYVKSINQRLKIQSKQEYKKSENKIDIPDDDPEKHFLEVWTNWYDFMGHDTTLFIQTVDEWRSFIKEKGIKTVQEYQALCEKYVCLPKEPADFYKGFSNIPNELIRINSRR